VQNTELLYHARGGLSNTACGKEVFISIIGENSMKTTFTEIFRKSGEHFRKRASFILLQVPLNLMVPTFLLLGMNTARKIFKLGIWRG